MSRRAVAAHRKRQTGKGLVRVEVQVPSADAPLIREAAKLVRGDSKEAALLRHILGQTKPRETGYDLMKAMTLGESLDVPDDLFERRRDPRFDYARDVEL